MPEYLLPHLASLGCSNPDPNRKAVASDFLQPDLASLGCSNPNPNREAVRPGVCSLTLRAQAVGLGLGLGICSLTLRAQAVGARQIL